MNSNFGHCHVINNASATINPVKLLCTLLIISFAVINPIYAAGIDHHSIKLNGVVNYLPDNKFNHKEMQLLNPSVNLDTLTAGVEYSLALLSSGALETSDHGQSLDAINIVMISRSKAWDSLSINRVINYNTYTTLSCREIQGLAGLAPFGATYAHRSIWACSKIDIIDNHSEFKSNSEDWDYLLIAPSRLIEHFDQNEESLAESRIIEEQGMDANGILLQIQAQFYQNCYKMFSAEEYCGNYAVSQDNHFLNPVCRFLVFHPHLFLHLSIFFFLIALAATALYFCNPNIDSFCDDYDDEQHQHYYKELLCRDEEKC